MLDVYKGFLIILVVTAHYNRGLLHDIIFLFHMPLFFIISGYLLDESKIRETSYIIGKTKQLIIPYAIYLLLDFIIVRRAFSLNSIAHMIWGGRALSGTYWYITCFLFALQLFSFCLKHFPDRLTKLLIFVGGGISVIESHLSERIDFLKSPGIPWNLDVALFALVYLAIGYYNKRTIGRILKSDERKLNFSAVTLAVLLSVFCYFNYRNGNPFYYFDMKPIYYKELFSAMVIPCAFGIVIGRLIHWGAKCRILDWLLIALAYLGQMTLPIMFLHVPLNTWKDALGYGRLFYILIGIGVPVIFTACFNSFPIMRKLFGMPDIKGYQSLPQENH